MKRPDDTFVFTPVLGERLRVLRLRVGLTQMELAQAMGRGGRKSGNLVGRLERGDERYPSLGLVADYLRGCRAGFGDILGFLDGYTARPTVLEAETMRAVYEVSKDLPERAGEEVSRYDYGMAKDDGFRHEPLPDREERVRRARKYGLSRVWAQRLRRAVVKIIEERGLKPGVMRQHFLQDYAAMVWRILNETRGGRLPERASLIDKATRLFQVEPESDGYGLAAVGDGVTDFFSRLEADGELDELPREPE